jgi:hypothetical protein
MASFVTASLPGASSSPVHVNTELVRYIVSQPSGRLQIFFDNQQTLEVDADIRSFVKGPRKRRAKRN